MVRAYEKTLVIIKADTIKRKLVGRIIQKFEDAGLEIVAMKMVKPTRSQAKKHYPGYKSWKISVGWKTINAFNETYDVEETLGTTDTLEVGDWVWRWNVKELSQEPIIVMVLGGHEAIKKVKEITGKTDPKKSRVGTIRGDFSTDTVINSGLHRRALQNVIHRSTNPHEAKYEISCWFDPKEINK